MVRSSKTLISGGLSGTEYDQAKLHGLPVLFLLRESGVRLAGEPNPWAGAPFWYPDFVFPTSMQTQVFNASQ